LGTCCKTDDGVRRGRQLLAGISERSHDRLIGGTGELPSAGLGALAPVAVEDGLALEAEITCPEADDLGSPSTGQDEDQQDRPVAPATQGVGHDGKEPAHLVGAVPPGVRKPPNLERRGGCWFHSDGVEIHLGVEQQFVPAGKAHPAFLVDDFTGLRDRLTAAGVPVVLDEPLPGYDRFYTSDPFGNRIEILSPHG
jgi:catechol 2,3-dioxygenase-like lactoylglutathione lyase family enzyme